MTTTRASFLLSARRSWSKAAEILNASHRRRIAAPGGLPAAWQAADVEWMIDGAGGHELSFNVLNAVDGVMTAATVGVAVSGASCCSTGRRKDAAFYIAAGLSISASSKRRRWWRHRPRPSRASTENVRRVLVGAAGEEESEMSDKGVHGPRFLDVILIRN